MSERAEPVSTRQNTQRADARRNQQGLLDAAASLFVEEGIDVPVRAIATRAGVGIGTIYRHFPTRAELVIAVYRHQVEACAIAGPRLLAQSASPFVALTEWLDLFVDFLVTKHGLAAALHADRAELNGLHAYFLGRLVPVCEGLLIEARARDEIQHDIEASTLMRAIGNLCIGAGQDKKYDARFLVHLLVRGLRF